jgi:hypothetical protein
MRAGNRLARFGAAALIVMMLAMALLPLTSTGVSAADNDSRIINSSVTEEVLIDDIVVEPEETPVPDPDLDPDVVSEEFDDELIDDLVVEPVEPGTIHVAKYGCGDDYNGDYYELAQHCQAMNADFGVYYTGGEQFFNGTFTASDIAPGAVTVTETIPAGYGNPHVFCSSTDATGYEGGFEQVLTEQGAAYFELEPGEYIYCDWYNVPFEQDGTITIKKWECPENLAFVVEPTRDDYLQACTSWMNDVTFHIDYEDDAETDLSGETGDDGDGTLVFEGVKAGKLTISEEIPSGYGDPVIFCGFGAFLDEDGDGVGAAIDGFAGGGLVEGGVLEHEFLPTETLYCDVFNFPYDNNDDVVIYKWLCPEDFNAYEASLEELLTTCDHAMEDVDFSLYGNGENFIGDMTSDSSGYVGFKDLDAGSYALNEELPSGYDKPIIFCDRPDYDFENWPVYGDASIQFDLYDGGWIACHWFNVPDHDGSITIYKYTCAPGYDLDAYGADPKSDCWTKTDGIRFDVYGDGYDDYGFTGDYVPGAVTFGGLDEGEYIVKEDVPAETVDAFVICQWEEELGPFKYETFSPYSTGGSYIGNTIDLELYKGTNIVCHWYNIPEDHDGGELIVIKYWCDGAIYDETHCELYGGGADFSIQDAGGYGSPYEFTTGWDGTTQLYLDAGAYSLAEIDRIWCKAKSDQVDSEGNVVIYDDETSYVTVFNCGPGKEKDPPAKKFPNTGVAEMVTETGSNGGSSMGLLFSMGMVVAIIGLRTAQTRTARIAIRQERGE